MSRCRVVITGLGVISPCGNTIEDNWRCLCNGTSGIAPISAFQYASFPAGLAGEVRQFNPRSYNIKPKSLKVMNRTIQYALAATACAVGDAAFSEREHPPESVGISLGTDGTQYTAEEGLVASCEAVGGDMRTYILDEARRPETPISTKDPSQAVNPLWPLSVLPNMSLCHIAIQHRFQGQNCAFSSPDAGGAQAIAAAVKSIQSGEAGIFIAGGSYALNTVHIISLSSCGLLAEGARPCRPFCEDAGGCVLGEGAVILVLESLGSARKRGAHIYAEIGGCASVFSSAGGDDPQAMRLCMEKALEDAQLSASDIDYINAEGKGVAQQDAAEAQAAEALFGSRFKHLAVSSTKPLTGYMLPAAGAFDALSTALSVSRDCVPPTLNHTGKEPVPGLPIAKKALKKQINCAISNTFGFTGEHVSLVIKKYQ